MRGGTEVTQTCVLGPRASRAAGRERPVAGAPRARGRTRPHLRIRDRTRRAQPQPRQPVQARRRARVERLRAGTAGREQVLSGYFVISQITGFSQPHRRAEPSKSRPRPPALADRREPSGNPTAPPLGVSSIASNPIPAGRKRDAVSVIGGDNGSVEISLGRVFPLAMGAYRRFAAISRCRRCAIPVDNHTCRPRPRASPDPTCPPRAPFTGSAPA